MMLTQDTLLDLFVMLGLAVILGICGTFRTDWRLIVGHGKSFV
jgi:hypothetical protein